MPKIFRKFKKKHVNNQNHSKKYSILFVILFIILFCVIIFNISDIISSLITQEKSIFYKDKIETTSFTVYAVSVGDYETFDAASSEAQKVIAQGGMGKVYESGEFYLIASIYPTLIEAQEIRDNLRDLGFDSKIININVREVFYDYKAKDKELIVSTINLFRNTFLDLYDLTLKFDSSEIDRLDADEQIASLCAKIASIRSSFLANKNMLQDEINSVIASSLDALYDNTYSLLYFTDSDIYFSSYLKCVMYENVILAKNVSSAFHK